MRTIIHLLVLLLSIIFFGCRSHNMTVVPRAIKPAFDLGDFALRVQLVQSETAIRKPLTVNLYYFEPDESMDEAAATIQDNYTDGDGDERFTVDSTNYDSDGSFWVNIEAASIVVFDIYDYKGYRMGVFAFETTGAVHNVRKELSAKSGRLAAINSDTGKYIVKVSSDCSADWASKIIYYKVGSISDNNMPYTLAQLKVMTAKNGWKKFSIRNDRWSGFTKTLPTNSNLTLYTTQKVSGNPAYSAVFRKVKELPANPAKDAKNFVIGGIINCSCLSN